MDRPQDIVLVSVPFVAGAGASALAGAAPQSAATAALAGTAACIAACVALKGRQAVLLAAMFFCLGAFCMSSAAIIPAPAGRPRAGAGPAQAALAGLSELIAGIPFRHPETNALLRALLTGQRDLLDRGTTEAFRTAGASHLLALSGLHLGIIYLIINTLLKIIGNSPAAFAARSAASVAFCGFYTLMTGASPSTVRAFIFITLNETARNCPGRRSTPPGVWCTAAMLQLAFRPGVISSAGFQLSYLAMLGIFLLYPVLKNWYPRAGKGRGRFDAMRRIWEAMALTVSCQAFTAPLVWLRFHTFPRYFLLTNLLALPLAEALMTGGVACTFLEALKIRSLFLTEATDRIACALTRVLTIIASC